MTRKDYELIASVLSEFRRTTIVPDRQAVTDVIAAELARAFTTDNPRFHPGRFLEACEHSVTYRATHTDTQIGNLPQP